MNLNYKNILINMSEFPLYDSLKKNLPKKDLTVKQKKDFIEKIDILDTNGHELIYALILSYYVDKEPNSIYTIPYEAKIKGDETEFNLQKLPIPLRNMLYIFINKHISVMEENKTFLPISL